MFPGAESDWLYSWKFVKPCCNVCGRSTLGTLISNEADGNKNVKKTIGFKSKTTSLHVHHTCLYISLPVFARKQATTTCYYNFSAWIWSLGIQRQEGSPTFDKVSVIKTKRTQIHFLSDVLVAFASLNLKVPICG